MNSVNMPKNPATTVSTGRDTVSALMSRSAHLGLAILVVLVAAAVLLFKTPPLPNTGEFGGVSLRIEYATTSVSRERGLGGRTSIPEDYGMLFVFPEDGLYGFWMKDTLVPLDMFWLDAQGHVVSIAQDVATSSYPNVFYPSAPARYVLETAAGFADAHSIATGTPLRLKYFPTVTK